MNVADVLRARVNQVLAEQRKTPAELARAMRRKSSWFSNFMNGRNNMPLATVDRIAEALQVDGCSLFDPSRLGHAAEDMNFAEHTEDEGDPAMIDIRRRNALQVLVTGLPCDLVDPAIRAILDVMAAAPGGDRRAIHEHNGTHGSG